jgi:hypothetical protein
VPDVQARARRVREHVEDVELLSPGVPLGSEGRVLVPIRLPLGLDRGDLVSELRVALRELGLMALRHSEKVRTHENLPVALDAGANPDRRDAYRARDLSGDFGGYGFDDNGIDPGAFEGLGAGDDLGGRFRAPALNFEPSVGVHALRLHADMAHDGDPLPSNVKDTFGDLFAALELHALEGTLLDEPARARDGPSGRSLVTHERHVADEMGS